MGISGVFSETVCSVKRWPYVVIVFEPRNAQLRRVIRPCAKRDAQNETMLYDNTLFQYFKKEKGIGIDRTALASASELARD